MKGARHFGHTGPAGGATPSESARWRAMWCCQHTSAMHPTARTRGGVRSGRVAASAEAMLALMAHAVYLGDSLARRVPKYVAYVINSSEVRLSGG